MAKITQIQARQILNAKGNPAVEVNLTLDDGNFAIASCPSGTSVSSKEAIELKDNDPQKFQGNGVLKAVENVNKIIAPMLLGMDASQQNEIDNQMIKTDGTPNKAKLGANAILPVSIANARASAKSYNLPLYSYLRQMINRDDAIFKIPTPVFNLINGGLHAGGNLDFQEFMIIPASSQSYSGSLNITYAVYATIRKILKQNGLSTLIGDEGGFAPTFQTNKIAILFLKQAIEEAKFRFGYDVFLGMDDAASSFYKDKAYLIKDKPSPLTTEKMAEYYEELNREFHFLYIEDPFAEDDWEGFQKLTADIANQTMIVGDDLVATNPYRLQEAIQKKAITGLIIKPNQIGSVIETLAVAAVAKEAGIKTVVSHRSGETNDDFVADLAVAISADYVKFGAPVRGERVAKYNRLLEIEEQIKSSSG